MNKRETESRRAALIVLGILLYLVIMFPPVEYSGFGRIYAILNWKGRVIWSEIFLEAGGALLISLAVYIKMRLF